MVIIWQKPCHLAKKVLLIRFLIELYPNNFYYAPHCMFLSFLLTRIVSKENINCRQLKMCNKYVMLKISNLCKAIFIEISKQTEIFLNDRYEKKFLFVWDKITHRICVHFLPINPMKKINLSEIYWKNHFEFPFGI